MMQMDDSIRTDQYVSTALADIPFRFSYFPPLNDLLQVNPPRFGTPYIPKGGGEHAIAPVRFAGFIDKQRPGERSILNITAGKEVDFKGDHCDFYVPLGEFLFMITQLRDVRPARESAKVAMKYHQEPTPPVFLETVNPSVDVFQLERYGGGFLCTHHSAGARRTRE